MTDRTTKLSGFASALLCTLCACGPDVSNEDSQSGSASATSTASAGTSSGVDSTPTQTSSATRTATETDTGDNTGNSTGATDVCIEFVTNEDSPTSLEVLNQSPEAIFLLVKDVCGDIVQLSGPGPDPTPANPPLCELPSCENLAAGMCLVACPGACQPYTIRIDPGAMHARPWQGTVWNPTSVPPECSGEDCGLDCEQETLATAGTYVMGITYSDCPNANPADCECPAGEATCTLLINEQLDLMSTSVSLEFSFPEEAAPQLVIL